MKIELNQDAFYYKCSLIGIVPTILLLLLAYLNYGWSIYWDIHLILWVPLLQFIIETLFFYIFHKKDFQKFRKGLLKISKINKKENIEREIKELEMIKNFIEADLNQAELENDKKSIQKFKKELQKIEKIIKELRDNLKKYDNQKR